MDNPEQLGSAHECFSELLHAIDPRVLIRIACAAAGIAVDEFVEVRYRNPRIHIPGFSKRARTFTVDLVYTVHTAQGKVVAVWIFEIQLSEDILKIPRWAFYPVTYAMLYGGVGRLAVFCPEPGLRELIRTKQIPRITPQPILIERDQIERITDYDDARERPELTILGCLYHAHEPGHFEDRVAVFRAAWTAIQTLDELSAQRYSVLVMAIVPQDVFEQGVAELREADELDEGRWELFSQSERKGHSFLRGRDEGRAEGREEGRDEGRAEGRDEGRAEGREEAREETRRVLRRTIVDMLELRGFVLSAAQRERIDSCEPLETLERWYAAVKAAAAKSTVDELLA